MDSRLTRKEPAEITYASPERCRVRTTTGYPRGLNSSLPWSDDSPTVKRASSARRGVGITHTRRSESPFFPSAKHRIYYALLYLKRVVTSKLTPSAEDGSSLLYRRRCLRVSRSSSLDFCQPTSPTSPSALSPWKPSPTGFAGCLRRRPVPLTTRTRM